jgi:hypothetical protein
MAFPPISGLGSRRSGPSASVGASIPNSPAWKFVPVAVVAGGIYAVVKGHDILGGSLMVLGAGTMVLQGTTGA